MSAGRNSVLHLARAQCPARAGLWRTLFFGKCLPTDRCRLLTDTVLMLTPRHWPHQLVQGPPEPIRVPSPAIMKWRRKKRKPVKKREWARETVFPCVHLLMKQDLGSCRHPLFTCHVAISEIARGEWGRYAKRGQNERKYTSWCLEYTGTP